MIVSLNTCQKGCSRWVARSRIGAAFHGAGPFGMAETLTAVRVAAPSAIADEYVATVSATALASNQPTLEFYDTLHGVGGIFSGPDWAILVGVKDMQDIAASVLASWPQDLITLFVAGRGVWPTAAALSRFAFEAAVRRCIAHELGHALIYRGAENPFEPDDEAGADFYAGRLDAALGRTCELGQMFFWSIGCRGPSCTHPSPDVRAAAYAAGYEQQLAAA